MWHWISPPNTQCLQNSTESGNRSTPCSWYNVRLKISSRTLSYFHFTMQAKPQIKVVQNKSNIPLTPFSLMIADGGLSSGVGVSSSSELSFLCSLLATSMCCLPYCDRKRNGKLYFYNIRPCGQSIDWKNYFYFLTLEQWY